MTGPPDLAPAIQTLRQLLAIAETEALSGYPLENDPINAAVKTAIAGLEELKRLRKFVAAVRPNVGDLPLIVRELLAALDQAQVEEAARAPVPPPGPVVDEEGLDEWGWPPEPDDDQTEAAGPAVSDGPAGPVAPPTSAAEATRPPGPAADANAPGAVAAGGTGGPKSSPVGLGGRPAGGGDPSLLEGGEP